MSEGDKAQVPDSRDIDERAQAVARILLRNSNPRVREAQRALREKQPQR